MLKKIFKIAYLSPLGRFISIAQRILGVSFRPFMVYGYYDRVNRQFRKLTRISSTAFLGDKKNISIGDNCWIWHHSILDGSNGITIGDGVQIGAWVGIFTHSSHIAIRLHGKKYIELDKDDRVGYVRSPVVIGDYTFIAAGAKILPGVKIGKGCIISAGSIVNKDVPDYSIAFGNPAKVIGSSTKQDNKFLNIKGIKDQYFDQGLVTSMKDLET